MPADQSREELIRTLLRSDAYPWNPDSVELIETHISWVFLAGDRVVKIKRPVHFDFVDLSDVELRHEACEAEFALNRRLSKDVYLGTIPITIDGDRLIVDGTGEPFEWATLMRRLPAENMLDVLLRTGNAPVDLAEMLANHLIPFHLHAAAICDRDTLGSADSVRAVLLDNLDELSTFASNPLGGVQLQLVDQSIRDYLAFAEMLLSQRVTDGWIREGHGDLRTEHICIEHDAIQIFDCVEFSQAIRCADIASDLSFLLMDLGRLGCESDANDLESRYRDAGFDLPEPLVRLYRAHRALVRSKIDCMTLGGGLRQHQELVSEATRYLDIASSTVLKLKPVLIAMTGLSGTGKSTIATAIARATGASLISSDVVRKQLAGQTIDTAAGWGQGIYTEEWNQATYDQIFRAAIDLIDKGNPVILDATFITSERREMAANLAQSQSVPFMLVETMCDEQVAAARITTRALRRDSASDADAAIQAHQRSLLVAGPISVPEAAIHVQVDTTTESGSRMDPFFSEIKRRDLIHSRLASG